MLIISVRRRFSGTWWIDILFPLKSSKKKTENEGDGIEHCATVRHFSIINYITALRAFVLQFDRYYIIRYIKVFFAIVLKLLFKVLVEIRPRRITSWTFKRHVVHRNKEVGEIRFNIWCRSLIKGLMRVSFNFKCRHMLIRNVPNSVNNFYENASAKTVFSLWYF